jgi:hypothetical protein
MEQILENSSQSIQTILAELHPVEGLTNTWLHESKGVKRNLENIKWYYEKLEEGIQNKPANFIITNIEVSHTTSEMRKIISEATDRCMKNVAIICPNTMVRTILVVLKSLHTTKTNFKFFSSLEDAKTWISSQTTSFNNSVLYQCKRAKIWIDANK